MDISDVSQEVFYLRGRVAVLESQVEFLMRTLKLTYTPETQEDDPRIVDALRKGRLLEAIKYFREANPTLSLDVAKQEVSVIGARNGIKGIK